IEFQELLKEENLNLKKDIIENLHSQNKIAQLINRFDYFSSVDISVLNNAILILTILYENREKYEIRESEILKHLALNVQYKIDDKKEKKLDTTTWLKSYVFEGDILSIKNKLFLLGKLWTSKNENQLWRFTENYISRSVSKL